MSMPEKSTPEADNQRRYIKTGPNSQERYQGYTFTHLDVFSLNLGLFSICLDGIIWIRVAGIGLDNRNRLFLNTRIMCAYAHAV